MKLKELMRRNEIAKFIADLYDGDLHAKRVLSLANATLGVLASASLAVHAIGQGLAQAMGTLSKHGVKQVDRLLSNEGIDVGTFFGYWVRYIVGARREIVVALDWTSFAGDGHGTIVLSMLTGHGRATPLMWKTVRASQLKGHQKRHENELLHRLREVMPEGGEGDGGGGPGVWGLCVVSVLGGEAVLRVRDSHSGQHDRHGCEGGASQWVGEGGRSRTLRGARVRGRKGVEVGTVVCVQDRKMKQPWCLVASEREIGTRTLIRYYAKRWGIETSFRDIKDMRFGMGMSAMRVSTPQRRDRMLLLSALAIGLLTLLGAAGESLGYDRWLRANTVKYRTHSLFRQGLMLYEHIPNWPEHRLRPLMERFAQLLMEQRVYREVFAVI